MPINGAPPPSSVPCSCLLLLARRCFFGSSGPDIHTQSCVELGGARPSGLQNAARAHPLVPCPPASGCPVAAPLAQHSQPQGPTRHTATSVTRTRRSRATTPACLPRPTRVPVSTLAQPPLPWPSSQQNKQRGPGPARIAKRGGARPHQPAPRHSPRPPTRSRAHLPTPRRGQRGPPDEPKMSPSR